MQNRPAALYGSVDANILALNRRARLLRDAAAGIYASRRMRGQNWAVHLAQQLDAEAKACANEAATLVMAITCTSYDIQVTPIRSRRRRGSAE